MAKSPVITRVEGARELRRTLKAAGDDLEDLKAAHAEAAAIVEPVARAKAPRGETGRLAGSVRSSGTKTMALVRAGYASVPYAGVQEWGWPGRNIPAQPFIVPAAHETEGRWYAVYMAEVVHLLGTIRGV